MSSEGQLTSFIDHSVIFWPLEQVLCRGPTVTLDWVEGGGVIDDEEGVGLVSAGRRGLLLELTGGLDTLII